MRQQQRSDALWRLAQDATLDDRTFVHAALGLGAVLLVPGQAFAATVGRVCGTTIALEAVNDDRLVQALPDAERAGSIAATPQQRDAIGRGVTRHWDDAGCGALLIVPFNAAHALYVVTFAASEPALRAFTADDDAFAESVASLIAARIQARWDAVPERDPLEVVTL